MEEPLNSWIQLAFRWLHVVAGVIWIGHLYFFNWVNGPLAKVLDGPTKKVVVPQLMPRALFWFRWGAAWTFISGWSLAGLVYYMGGMSAMSEVVTQDPDAWSPGLAYGIVLAGLVGSYVYDVIQKTMKGSVAANAICLAGLAALVGAMQYVGKWGGRAIFIHTGMFFGTTMALNVWMRIWPAQKKIIAAVRDGQAPDADLVALAGLRSRHNTFMSVPLLALMVSNHYAPIYGMTAPMNLVVLAAIVAVGFGAAHLLYGKSATVPGF